MKTKNLLTLLFITSALPVSAEVTYNAALVSDYVFEGISQSDEKPALQGGLDYSHKSGFYAGAWGSTVDFGNNAEGAELDFYMGFKQNIDKNLAYDVGYVFYKYAGDSGLNGSDYSEIYASLTFNSNTNIGLWLADDESLFGGSSTRLKVSHSIALPEAVSLNLAAHYWMVNESIFQGKDNYFNFLIGLSKDFKGYSFALNLTDTSIDNSQLADARIALSVSRTFK